MPAKHRHPWINRIADYMMPSNLGRRQRMNFFYCQLDAVSVGFSNGVDPFLAVFLTRLGASNFQVGLLSSIPSFAGLLLSIGIGRFLQSRRNIVPWYSASRAIGIMSYTMAGLASFLLPDRLAIPAILVIWLVLSVPLTFRGIAFNVTMNRIAGPEGRYALMSRRWSVIGLTSAVSTILAGQVLDLLGFPHNYEIVFIGFSVIALGASLYITRRYDLTDNDPEPDSEVVETTSHLRMSIIQQLRDTVQTVIQEKAFLSNLGKRLVFSLGTWLVMPLFTLYYVREVHASDALIGWFSTIQKIMLLVGYGFWTRIRNRRGSRFILLSTLLGTGLYPALIASTRNEIILMVIAALGGFFSAGLNLVFFDELMKTIPERNSSTFIGVNQTLEHLMAIIGPVFNTRLADFIGLSWALVLGAVVRLISFAMFAKQKREFPAVPPQGAAAS